MGLGDTDTMSISYIDSYIVGKEIVDAQTIFNPNAFLGVVRPDVIACSEHLAVFYYSKRIILNEVNSGINNFYLEIKGNKAFSGFKPSKSKNLRVYYQDITYLAGLHSLLLSVKSFLDVYTKVMIKSVDPKSSTSGFKKGTFNGNKISGGNFLKWLKNSVSASTLDKDKLIRYIEQQSHGWITEIVDWRDVIAHKGLLRGLDYMSIELNCPISKVKKSDINLPKMPNGTDIVSFCNKLDNNLKDFIHNTLILLPNINMKLISFK